MFSVRLPSVSTRHVGPPGPWGPASQAAGTVGPSRSQRERWIRPHPAHLTPTGPRTPPLSPRQQPHIQPLKDTPTPSTPPPAKHSHSRTIMLRALGTQERTRHSHTQASARRRRQGRAERRSGPQAMPQARRAGGSGLTGLPGGQLQLGLVGAAAVGPGADHLAADCLLAHQGGGAVGVPPAEEAGAPTAFQLQQLLLGDREGPAGVGRSGPAVSGQASPSL